MQVTHLPFGSLTQKNNLHMKKIVLFAGLLLAGSSYAQHQKGEWFVTAGGRTPFTLKPLRFSP